jgi:hypothetical protein
VPVHVTTAINPIALSIPALNLCVEPITYDTAPLVHHPQFYP